MNLIVKGNTATLGGKSYPVAIGRGGYVREKEEGDGGSPLGVFPLREVYYRPDRVKNPPKTLLDLREMSENDGWCDDPKSAQYNCFVKLPFDSSHEKLWREDHVYNLILVVGYNDAPPVPGKGSAIFIHVAREGYTPTEGCIAFKQEDLLEVLKNLTPDSQVEIQGSKR